MTLIDEVTKGNLNKVQDLLKSEVKISELDEAIKISEQRMSQDNVFNLLDTNSNTEKVYKKIHDLLNTYKGLKEFEKHTQKNISKDPTNIVGEFLGLGGKKIRRTRLKKTKRTLKKRNRKHKTKKNRR